MITRLSRRAMLKSMAGSALLATIGMPAITKAQADAIRIGHLTPLTGFLGPLGEYAVMGDQARRRRGQCGRRRHGPQNRACDGGTRSIPKRLLPRPSVLSSATKLR